MLMTQRRILDRVGKSHRSTHPQRQIDQVDTLHRQLNQNIALTRNLHMMKSHCRVPDRSHTGRTPYCLE